MKKLIFLIAIGALAYWLVKDRLAGEPDEFIFAEEPPPTPGGESPEPPTPGGESPEPPTPGGESPEPPPAS